MTERSHPYREQRTQSKVVQQSNDYGDFDPLLIKRYCVVEIANGTSIRGIIEEARKFWLAIRTNNGVVYVNKAYIVSITPTNTKQENVTGGPYGRGESPRRS